MGKYIDHRLVARSEPENTFWTDSTSERKARQRDFIEGLICCVMGRDAGAMHRVHETHS